MHSKLIQQCVAELVGTFALVFVGGCAIANNPGLLGVSLAHGLTMAVMVTATAAISGGHLNPAVTLGLFIGGKMDAKRLGAYWAAQLIGASAAGFLLLGMLGDATQTGVQMVSAGTPDLARHVSLAQGIGIEAVLTFFLVFVVYGSAVDARAPKVGGLYIGLTVALDMLAGRPLTGAAMNPARTFGPALASGHWSNHAVYWIGPLLGGAAAGVLYGRFLTKPCEG